MRLHLELIMEVRPTLERAPDRYTLLMVGSPSPSNFLPLYWRLVDPTFNLVEVAIDPRNGCLVSVKVPLYNGDLPERKEMPGQGLVRRQGLPCFRRDLWPALGQWPPMGHYYTVEGRCSAWIAQNSLCISLFKDVIEYIVEPCPELWLLFNRSGDLCGLTAPDLSVEERRALAENKG